MLRHVSVSLFIAIAPIVLMGAQGKSVGRLAPVADFPQLPVAVARDLMNRKCRIPRVQGERKDHNVIQGQFEKPGQRDWAVLCLQGNASAILVYWNGSAKGPAQLARMDETITRSKNDYYRVLQVVGDKFIRSHYDASASGFDSLPSTLDHDGIDDGIVDKGSYVHYFYRGKWLRLPGSD